jgi:hypothetical protein
LHIGIVLQGWKSVTNLNAGGWLQTEEAPDREGPQKLDSNDAARCLRHIIAFQHKLVAQQMQRWRLRCFAAVSILRKGRQQSSSALMTQQ